MNLLQLAQNRIADLKKKTANEWAGPCPECGGTDRFLVWTHRQAWHCRGCNLSGDAIEFLRKFDGKSCPDAHAELGLDCSNTSCQAWDKCRLGARANGGNHRQSKRTESLHPPVEKPERPFEPATAQTPEQKWLNQAALLIEKAHAALLDCPEQVAYLTSRGLPLEAVKKGQLGWIPDNRYPSREAWGLPVELKEDGKKKKMFIPSGILIPFFDEAGQPHRIRIRRNDIRPDDARYFWVKGSGDDVPVIGGVDRRGLVVVESDLDAFMVRWQCRDLDISVIPLGTCSAKPKGWAMQALGKALAILVAHDFEPRTNEKTGKAENPGGQGARWWLQQFPRATRWPVPVGKDPGEYFEQGGDIRAWVLAGLPAAFHIKYEPPKPAPVKLAAWKLRTSTGLELCIVADKNDKRLYAEKTGLVTLDESDLEKLKGMDDVTRAEALKVLAVFPGEIKSTRPLKAEAAPLPIEPEYVQQQLL